MLPIQDAEGSEMKARW